MKTYYDVQLTVVTRRQSEDGVWHDVQDSDIRRDHVVRLNNYDEAVNLCEWFQSIRQVFRFIKREL